MRREDLIWLLRGIRELHRLTPWNLLAKCIRSLCNAAIPFVDLFFSARIITWLSEGRPLSQIFTTVGLTLGIHLFLMLVSKEMDAINYRKWNAFYYRYQLSIGEKTQSLPYPMVEDPSTHEKIKKLDDAMRIGHYGLIKLHSRIPLLLENLGKVMFSLGFLVSAMVRKTTEGGFFQTIPADGILVLLVILASAVTWRANRTIAERSYDLLGKLSRENRWFDYYMDHYLDGHLAGKDIRLYRQDSLIRQEMEEAAQQGGTLADAVNRTVFRGNMHLSFVDFLLILYTYLYIGFKAIAGAFPIGSIVKYSGGVLQFAGAFTGMMDALAQLEANTPYLKDYFRFMDQPEDTEEEGKEPADGRAEIRVESVSFRYPGRKENTLDHISFSLRPGEKAAIVGPNGSGKTTMIKLLCRLYEPQEGHIYYDQTDIHELDSKAYHRRLGVVFQDFKLFSMELGENTAAAISVDEQKAVRSLTEAGFSERLKKLPKGLHTCLYKNFDENGVEISGGEAQKIAIARALYKEAPLVILDEPTAALDPMAEAGIYEQLNEITRDRTTIFISHRLSSCRFCDRILVFSEGELVQQGTHEELLRDTEGLYYRLWTSQAGYYQC